jgi:hypothetical protein
LVDTVTSRAYLEANQHRTNGTGKQVILATRTRIAANYSEALS